MGNNDKVYSNKKTHNKKDNTGLPIVMCELYLQIIFERLSVKIVLLRCRVGDSESESAESFTLIFTSF